MKFKNYLTSLYMIFSAILIHIIKNPKKVFFIPIELFIYFKDYFEFLNKRTSKEKIHIRPILFQKNVDSKFDAHYVIQSWWASLHINKSKINVHHDISSNIAFVTQLSSTIKVNFYEYNLPLLKIPNLNVKKGSLEKLPFKDKSIESLSCLHVLEHIGLGRYGDKIDPEGLKKSCYELARVLKKNGTLYVSFPIGKERTEFNAQRVIDPIKVIDYFLDLRLKKFSMIDDQKKFVDKAKLSLAKQQHYACGLYIFTR